MYCMSFKLLFESLFSPPSPYYFMRIFNIQSQYEITEYLHWYFTLLATLLVRNFFDLFLNIFYILTNIFLKPFYYKHCKNFKLIPYEIWYTLHTNIKDNIFLLFPLIFNNNLLLYHLIFNNLIVDLYIYIHVYVLFLVLNYTYSSTANANTIYITIYCYYACIMLSAAAAFTCICCCSEQLKSNNISFKLLSIAITDKINVTSSKCKVDIVNNVCCRRSQWVR